jgi:hypothetical protein
MNTHINAVQYLIDKILVAEKIQITLTKCGHMICSNDGILEEILDMHKQQVKEAYNQGYRDAQIDGPEFKRLKDVSCFDDAENYYNDTYTI